MPPQNTMLTPVGWCILRRPGCRRLAWAEGASPWGVWANAQSRTTEVWANLHKGKKRNYRSCDETNTKISKYFLQSEMMIHSALTMTGHSPARKVEMAKKLFRGFEGYHENALIQSFEMSPLLIC